MKIIISCSVSYVILWILFYILLGFNYKNHFEHGFSLRNNFKFETHNFKNDFNVYLRFAYVFLSVFGIFPFIYFLATNEINYTFDIYFTVAGALLLISIIFKILLFFTKTLNINLFIKEYVFRFISFIGVIGVLIAGIMITISENLRLYNENSGLLRGFLVVFVILFLLNISCLFFSNFYNWFKLEKNESGELKKPNIILTAMYEWIFDFSEIIIVILAAVLAYFMI